MEMLADPQYKTEDGAALRLWYDSAQNKFLSEQNGRPLYDEVLYAEVITPGSRDSTPVFELERVFCAEANRTEPKRGSKYAEFAKYIDDFKRGEQHDASLTGTPLKQWSEMTRAMVSTLRAAEIHTVDSLANLPDSKLAVVGPDGRTWREKAKAYIELSKNAAYVTELAAKFETVNNDLAASLEREKVLSGRIAALEAQGGAPTPDPVPKPTPEAAAGSDTQSATEAEQQANPAAPVAAEDETLVPAKPPTTKSII